MIFAGSPSILDNTTLEEFFEARKKVIEEDITVTNRGRTVIGQVHSMPAIQYEVMGIEEGLAITYKLALIRGEQSLIMVIAWSDSNRLKINRPVMEQVIESIRELPGRLIDETAQKMMQLASIDKMVTTLPGQFEAVLMAPSRGDNSRVRNRHAFSEEFLMPLAQRYISNLGDHKMMHEVINRHQKPDFLAIKTAEKEADNPDYEEERKKFFIEFLPDAPENRARLDLMRELIEADLIAVQISANYAMVWETVMLAMIDISQMDDPPAPEQITEKMQQMYESGLAGFQKELPVLYYFIYRKVPDRDIRSYINYLKGPQGRYIQSLTREMTGWLIGAGGYEFKRNFE